MKETFTIGVDFGTDSVRVILADTTNGNIVAAGHEQYSRWSKRLYCNVDKNQFRQHPSDYTEALIAAIKAMLAAVNSDIIERIAAVSVATTGSTPVAVNREGVPLALTKDFEVNPNAMFILWKDHSALNEAAEINHIAHNNSNIDYTKYSGGEYSSEWFWAKVLHIIRTDELVRTEAYSWVEHCDWITALLTGNTNPQTLMRSRCAAGHKAMWNAEWNGLPPEEFLVKIDPLLKGVRERLYSETYTSDTLAGTISKHWAEILGLPENVKIGVGTLDAHMGAIGGGIKPNQLIKVIGTSTCDMMIVPEVTLQNKVVAGICGQVDGSIIPGMIGLEAGQSAFGDIYAWFRDILYTPTADILNKSKLIDESTKTEILTEIFDSLLTELSVRAEKIPVDDNGTVAVDWMNGRRTPYSNQNVKGGIVGLNLSTSAPNIFKSLVEATAFGSKKIMIRIREEGVQIDSIIAVGGVAKKSDFIMQTLSDVLDCPIVVVKSVQTCALGAAMAAAVAAKIHPSFQVAQQAMGSGFEKVFNPIPSNVEKYIKLYEQYTSFGKFIENPKSENECESAIVTT